MSIAMPSSTDSLMKLDWSFFETELSALLAAELTAETFDSWLARWSNISKVFDELMSRLYVATSVDTTDQAAEDQLNKFLDEVYPKYAVEDNKLKNKLIASGITTPATEIPIKKIRAEAEVFTEKNIPLSTEEQKLGMEYDKIIGGQTVVWDGQETTLSKLSQVYQETDRARREKAFRLEMERRLENRATLNELWSKFLANRVQQAENLGLGKDFRAIIWKRNHRFDYTPEDCRTFHQAIEDVVVPAAVRIYERRKQALGLDTLRPWDTAAAPEGQTPLRPFSDVKDLVSKPLAMLEKVDSELANYFRTMDQEGLLDLANRKGKAPGGYCTSFAIAQRPFIFMNAVGSHSDVVTLLHEAGHAFHVFETATLPYEMQKGTDSEVAEVASMSMELLASPYLEESEGGFYTARDAARARIEHLEKLILFWPYMAVVDAFQHWVYENPSAAMDSRNCDAAWSKQWDRFMKGIDWTGLDDEKATGWHRKLHIYQVPMYYIEYGLAQLGAVQVWRQSLSDQAKATADYRAALQLGGTASIPDFFKTAGAKFAFDAATLNECVSLIEKTIKELEAKV